MKTHNYDYKRKIKGKQKEQKRLEQAYKNPKLGAKGYFYTGIKEQKLPNGDTYYVKSKSKYSSKFKRACNKKVRKNEVIPSGMAYKNYPSMNRIADSRVDIQCEYKPRVYTDVFNHFNDKEVVRFKDIYKMLDFSGRESYSLSTESEPILHFRATDGKFPELSQYFDLVVVSMAPLERKTEGNTLQYKIPYIVITLKGLQVND